MKKLLAALAVLGALGFAGYFVLTAPFTWSALHPTRDVADGNAANLVNGEALFYAGGCGTCHATPTQKLQTVLGGGLALTSGFGTFYMPNISPHQTDGIGAWTSEQFTRAMREGVSANGDHQYPSFPYTSTQRMTANDLRDMFAFIKTLPPVTGKARDHDLSFPFTMRRGVGLWKLLFLDGEALLPNARKSQSWNRGRYLVEGPAHCAECHSQRNLIGATKSDMRFAGAPDPEGHDYIPNITQDETGIGFWSQRQITDYLTTGTTPIGTQAGESMTAVVANLAHLTPDDRAAMAEYIKSLAPIDAPNAGAPALNRTAVVRMLPAASSATVSPASALAAPADSLAQADTLYTVATKPIFLERSSADAKGAGDGRLLPASKVTVVARDGDMLQVRIDGWQQDGSRAAFYALQGQRIMVAALGLAAVAKVVSQPGVEDPATKLTWFQGSVTVWISKDGLNPDLAKIWSYSSNLYTSSCGTCHATHPTNAYLANQWIGSLSAMKRFVSLEDSQYRMLQTYLQFHSKDVNPSTTGAKP